MRSQVPKKQIVVTEPVEHIPPFLPAFERDETATQQ